jgi:hypothetical protein
MSGIVTNMEPLLEFVTSPFAGLCAPFGTQSSTQNDRNPRRFRDIRGTRRTSSLEVPVHDYAFFGTYFENRMDRRQFIVSEAQDVSKIRRSDCH